MAIARSRSLIIENKNIERSLYLAAFRHPAFAQLVQGQSCTTDKSSSYSGKQAAQNMIARSISSPSSPSNSSHPQSSQLHWVTKVNVFSHSSATKNGSKCILCRCSPSSVDCPFTIGILCQNPPLCASPNLPLLTTRALRTAAA